VQGLVTALGLGALAPSVGGILNTAGTDVKRDVEKRQLLNDLSPDVQSLVTALGLGALAPSVGGILNSAGTDVKREVEKRQLLSEQHLRSTKGYANSSADDLSPDVQGLVTTLGLGSLAPSVGGILNTAGTDVKRSPQLLSRYSASLDFSSQLTTCR
jgi:hypothetical protein